MSFSVQTNAHSAADIRSAIEHVEPGASLSDRQTELLRRGKAAAIAILDSGDLGDADAERTDTFFSAAISGHGSGTNAEPGDSVTVSVFRTPPPE